jgi:hypothetical protein
LAVVVEQGGGHLGAAGVVDADEQTNSTSGMVMPAPCRSGVVVRRGSLAAQRR